jgi:asparagine synthetase B (glutamine-hydrolysing)
VATPPGTPWTSAYDYLASRAVDAGCGVLLNGEGGEWMRAQRELAADLLRNLDLAALFRLAESERRFFGAPRWRSARTILWRSGVRGVMRQSAAAALRRMRGNSALERRRRKRLLSWMPDWLAPDVSLRRDFASRWAATLPKPAWSNFHRRALVHVLNSPETVVWMDDAHEYARRFGIEALEPFHDQDLVEFVFSIPPEHLCFGSRVKALPLASIRARLPGLSTTTLGIAWPERVHESMLVREGARGLELLDGLPVLSDLEIVAPNPIVNALSSGNFSGTVGFQEAWRAMAMEAWLQCRVRPRRP